MPTYRPRSARRARSLTGRITGIAVIVLVGFVGAIALLIDPLERGGAPALFALFVAIVAISTVLALAVTRAHMHALADLIARRAPEEAYPRDGIVIARAVERALDPTQPVDPPVLTQADEPVEDADFWSGAGLARSDEPSLLRRAPDYETETAAPSAAYAAMPGPADDDPPTAPVPTIFLGHADDLALDVPAQPAPAQDEMRADAAVPYEMPPAPEPSAPEASAPEASAPEEAEVERDASARAPTNGTAEPPPQRDLEDIVAELRRIAEQRSS